MISVLSTYPTRMNAFMYIVHIANIQQSKCLPTEENRTKL